jgi:hypothetical protein
VSTKRRFEGRRRINYGMLGDIMYINVVLGKPVVVFNSLKSAFDVLERRASNSSRRPQLLVANGILYGGLGLALMDHGDA